VRLPPTGDGRGRGRWGPTRPAVENCGLRGAKPPGAVRCSPRDGALQTKPATSSCRAVCAAPPTGDGRGRGWWARGGRQLKTAAFVGRNRRGRLVAAPAGGLADEARDVQLPGVLCDFLPRALAAAEGVGARGGRQLKTAAFSCETARRGSTQPPQGGFANEARNFQLPGVLCDFHPRAMAAAEGVGPSAHAPHSGADAAG